MGTRIAIAGRLLQVANLEVDPMHARGSVVNQRRVTIAQVLNVDLLDFRFLGLEIRQADFDSLGVEEIFQRLDRFLVLLITNQVNARRAARRGTGGGFVDFGLLAFPPRPQQALSDSPACRRSARRR